MNNYYFPERVSQFFVHHYFNIVTNSHHFFKRQGISDHDFVSQHGFIIFGKSGFRITVWNNFQLSRRRSKIVNDFAVHVFFDEEM